MRHLHFKEPLLALGQGCGVGHTEEDLIDGAKVLGAMEFMELSEGAQVVFV